jgi:hypothetical protein
MNTAPNSSPVEFCFVPQKDLPYKLSKFQSYRLRQRLPKGIYWVQSDRRVLWNQVLIIDYFTNGIDNPQHLELLESYATSLPVAIHRSP